MLIKYWRYKTS